MRYLKGKEEKEALHFIAKAVDITRDSTCFRSQCGSVIVKDGERIGGGFNSPPGNQRLERCLKDDLPEDFISDRTCCVHAEDRAIRDAIEKNPEKIRGSRLYYIRLKDKKIMKAGNPYCTWCSKTALDVGIAEFVLWHEEGIGVYDTREYNKLSYQFKEKS